jgi:hypothetical protein
MNLSVGLQVVLVSTLGSFIFLWNPNVGQYLYLEQGDPGPTCTTQKEWIWIVGSSLALLATPA